MATRSGDRRRDENRVADKTECLAGDAAALAAVKTSLMIVTNRNEYALLSLAAVKPLACLPDFHKAIADRLASKGLLRQQNGEWHPTAAGLKVIRKTVH